MRPGTGPRGLVVALVGLFGVSARAQTATVDHLLVGVEASGFLRGDSLRDSRVRPFEVVLPHGLGVTGPAGTRTSSELTARVGFRDSVGARLGGQGYGVPIGFAWTVLARTSVLQPLLSFDIGGIAVHIPDPNLVIPAREWLWAWTVRGTTGVQLCPVRSLALRLLVDCRWEQVHFGTHRSQDPSLPASECGASVAVLWRFFDLGAWPVSMLRGGGA